MGLSNRTPGTIQLEEPDVQNPGPYPIFASFTEDWWAVIIAAVIITSILFFNFLNPTIQLTIPTYKWVSRDDLFGSVFSTSNVFLILLTGVGFLILSSIAIWLSGGGLKKFVAGFSFIFTIAILSLVIAATADVQPFGNGLINGTWKVADGSGEYILQKVNHQVF